MNIDILKSISTNGVLSITNDNWDRVRGIVVLYGAVVDNNMESLFRLVRDALEKESYEFLYRTSVGDERILIKFLSRIDAPVINYSDYFQYFVETVSHTTFVALLDYTNRAITSITCTGNGTVEIMNLYTTTVDGEIDILSGHLQFIFGCRLTVTGNIRIAVTYSEISNKDSINSIRIHNLRSYETNVVAMRRVGRDYMYALKYSH